MNKISPKNVKLCSVCGKFEIEEIHDGFKISTQKNKKTSVFTNIENTKSTKVKSLF